jgi:hypothetical protein
MRLAAIALLALASATPALAQSAPTDSIFHAWRLCQRQVDVAHDDPTADNRAYRSEWREDCQAVEALLHAHASVPPIDPALTDRDFVRAVAQAGG